MSTVRANNILDAAGGNTATINGMTPTAQSLQGFRNRIINGDMRIAQRGTSAVTFDTNATYILDRWTQNNGGGATITGQQSTTAPVGFTNSLLVTVTSGGAPSSGQLRVVRQKIEGFNAADLGWGTASAQTVTASFWVRSNITGTFACYVTNASYNRSQVQTFSISASNTWEYKTVVFAGDTSGTWATDSSTGIEFGFDVGSGSNFDATAGVWNAAFDTKTSGAAILSATTSNNIFITGVQLEAGSVATPFERRDYGRELIMCQRYHVGGAGTAASVETGPYYIQFFSGISYSSGQTARVTLPMKVQMRATPSLQTSNNGQFGKGYFNAAGASISLYDANKDFCSAIAIAAATTSFDLNFAYALDAEL